MLVPCLAIWCVPAWPVAAEQSPELLVRQFRQDTAAGIERRGLQEKFDTYQKYSDGRLDASEGTNTWSDKTGNCRLGWYDGIIRAQLESPVIAERFTRKLHEAVLDRDDHLRKAMAMATERLGVSPAGDFAVPEPGSPDEALQIVSNAVARARAAFTASLAPLSTNQVDELRGRLYDVTTQQIEGSSAYFRDKGTARRLCDTLEAMDRQSLLAAGRHVLALADEDLLGALSQLSPRVLQGDGILIGGTNSDAYHLDELGRIAVVIDLGGNDTYAEGSLSAERPVLVIIDLGGDDTYRGTKPGIQGGAVLGVSLLVDVAGNDVYDAQDVAQGACLGGVGILVDMAGNDSYRGLRRNQGSALGGIGMHVDRGGDDSYHAALYAQGFGGPLGFGVLDDLDGADHYYAGGKWLDGYEDTRGYDGWSQGVGAGPRGTANGGVGVLLDGGGDDVYEFDYFSHGGGYWFAVGLARDFGGNDQRLGSTRLAYDGSERGEPIFLRWGIGWQAHYGLGFVLDDKGNDSYGGDIVGIGFSWDVGVAGVLDFAGDDHYQLSSGGQGRQAGYGMVYDVGGDDRYGGSNFGGAPAGISYHPMPDCGGNFAFSINYGGTDVYGEESLNNVDLERGSPGGFLIDRDSLEP